ncbi:MAG: RidA family protein [Vicinamibacterales bacterium]|nr:RidA family protein [Vicinamibacterales bacterium]
MKAIVSSADAPQAAGPYSQAIRAGGLLFVAGQIPLDPAGQMIEGDVTVQARRVLDNIGAILKAAGLSFPDVVRTTVYLADMNDLPAMNQVYGTYFSLPYPARATVQVARLPRDVRIEIEAIAAY